MHRIKPKFSVGHHVEIPLRPTSLSLPEEGNSCQPGIMTNQSELQHPFGQPSISAITQNRPRQKMLPHRFTSEYIWAPNVFPNQFPKARQPFCRPNEIQSSIEKGTFILNNFYLRCRQDTVN